MKKTRFSPTAGPLRKLTIAASSVFLDQFDKTLDRVGKTSLVGDMEKLRTMAFNAYHFLQMVKRQGDVPVNTGLEKLKMLTYGSSALKYISHEVNTYYVLPPNTAGAKRKLLLCEDMPLTAQFWEMCFNIAYIEPAVLHAGLSDLERVALVNKFNEPQESLLVFIIMHSVSAQGVNLDIIFLI